MLYKNLFRNYYLSEIIVERHRRSDFQNLGDVNNKFQQVFVHL